MADPYRYGEVTNLQNFIAVMVERGMAAWRAYIAKKGW